MRHAPLGVYGGPSLGDGLCLPAVTPVLVFFGQRSFTLEGQRIRPRPRAMGPVVAVDMVNDGPSPTTDATEWALEVPIL